ncbi:cytochrome P450 [Mesobacillus campisalis]|uniref:cytochrome P450 n=1 Tax=Mesobacillus campisalis TaxID=1408103 RepID=UPI00069BAD07|nr:cytochrome P450 [Mesobacillus campisalis]
MEKLKVIPQPKKYGPLGNVPLLDKEAPTLSFCQIAKDLGPIYRFEFFGGFSTIFVSGHKWAAEVCDDSKFDKSLAGGLSFVRAFAGDGLFTGKTQEPNWQKAHNILVPSFSQQAMKGYHSMMVDIALQLVQKWARLNPGESIDVADDMTKLTLDTIGLCGFNYRFNSFYREGHHPFILNMVRSLDEAMHQSTRMPIQNQLMFSKKKQFDRDVKEMFALVDKLIADRRAKGDQGETDLLARMLSAKDPQTGEQLDDQNIRYQIITFLIAGHETTSGLLSFALYFMLKHPEVLKKAYEEVDAVVSGPVPTFKQVLELKYIKMILNESLRLYPTAPQFTLYAKEDMVLGNQYPIKKRQNVVVLLPELHRDKEAWGEDAEDFRPERFADPGKVPHDAFKPFGNGQRACIGMQFAMHEATLLIGMILKHFQLVDQSSYVLKIKQTMTLKPDNFTMSVNLRNQNSLEMVPVSADREAGKKTARQEIKIKGADQTSLLVLYGSNMGTAEEIAKNLANRASEMGIPSEAAPLDSKVGQIPKNGAVLIVTSSYNGKPPKNARKFVKWLDDLEPGTLNGVKYAVFGCGDRNWASTYQNVPSHIDQQLAKLGAERFSVRGEGDASGDFERQLDRWKKQIIKDALGTFGLEFQGGEPAAPQGLSIKVLGDSPARHEAVGYVQQLDGRDLEEILSQRAVHQVAILSGNTPEDVIRVLKRFRLNGNAPAILKANGASLKHLPLETPMNLYDLITQCLDLQRPATKQQIARLASLTVCPPHKRELEEMIQDDAYEVRIIASNVTMLDLVEKYEACEVSFEEFVALSAPFEAKLYSETNKESLCTV